jgi:hypothetical protein
VKIFSVKNYDYCPENCATESEPPVKPPTPPRPPSVATCAPEQEEFLQFRDQETGIARRPTTWQIVRIGCKRGRKNKLRLIKYRRIPWVYLIF